RETLLERAVAKEDLARGHAEGDEIRRPVEPVAETVERAGVACELEVDDEPEGRGPHRAQRDVKLAAEQVDAPVGEARGQEGDDFAVARVGVAEGTLQSVASDAGAVVEPAVEPLERRPER